MKIFFRIRAVVMIKIFAFSWVFDPIYHFMSTFVEKNSPSSEEGNKEEKKRKKIESCRTFEYKPGNIRVSIILVCYFR